MRETLERLCELYNAALQERRDARRYHGASVTRFMQERQLKDVRVVRPEYARIHSHLMQDAIVRLDRAFCEFFRRCRAGENPGFPRFKQTSRYRTFTFKDAKNRNGARLVSGGSRVELSGVGRVKIKIHRPIQGTIKQISCTLSGDGHWYAAFVCIDVPKNQLPRTGQSTGIDVGISAFAVLESGERVENPRLLQRESERLAQAQRVVTRRKKRSARHRKAIFLLRKQFDKVSRSRRDFHHKLACDLVARFDSIKVEDLNIQPMMRSRLAKPVMDAAWSQFFAILASKAECAGRELIRVDPRGTSQECSGCGVMARKSLADRIHVCRDCGLVLDRDQNAARNIGKRLGHSRRVKISQLLG